MLYIFNIFCLLFAQRQQVNSENGTEQRLPNGDACRKINSLIILFLNNKIAFYKLTTALQNGG